MKPQNPELTEQEVEILELKRQVEEKNSAYLRALADYHNLEKRSLANSASEIRRLMTSFLKQLIEIKSDLDQAETFNKDQGLKLVRNKFEALLKKYDVVEFNPLNEEFSPETMECVQLETGKKENNVLKVLERGYFYQGELLKAAKVVVSKLEVSLPNAEN